MDEATRISLKDQFNSLLVRAIEGRRGGMALMRVLEELDFYNSPASAKHHLNVPGGLVMHSLNVARAALELCDKMPQFAKCNKGAVLTAALLHDVCKAGQYIKKPDGSYRYEDREHIAESRTGERSAKYTTAARKLCACTWLT